MVDGVLEMAADRCFEVISIGYPGVVNQGAPAREPHHLAPGWIGFDFEAAFGRPVRIANDAAMQALGSYRGGKMLFLGLGTGLGSALIVDGQIVVMELGHLRRSKRHDYEDLLGKRGYKRLGKKKWRRKVHAVVEGFSAALLPDEIVIGGGQADLLKTLPPRSRLGNNAAAFFGGFRLWDESLLVKSPNTYKDLP
ncbi:ROK family protein [Pseudomonas sp. JAI111]|uniref:ROK family protein n=1 Tax=Pseudomonas sp. JAI111 TaxID=2735913 RepID=UPI00216A5E59|nr:ROK family protein [Pseudomonas sp. JAI111]